MKNLTFTIAFLFLTQVADAQIKVGINSTTTNKYKCDEIGNHIYISKVENLSINSKSDLRPVKETREVKFNKPYAIQLAFKEALGEARVKELLRDTIMLTTLYFDDKGKIITVNFMLNKKTLLTVTELEAVEGQIKRTVSVIIPDRLKGDYRYQPYVVPIKFAALSSL